jgi:hypothetical protein
MSDEESITFPNWCPLKIVGEPKYPYGIKKSKLKPQITLFEDPLGCIKKRNIT